MLIKRNIALSDSGFVFNPSTGDSFSTNPIGLQIIRMLKDDSTYDEIKEEVLSTYATDEEIFEADFKEFVDILHDNGLTEEKEKKKKS